MSAHSERNPYSGGFTYIALLAAIVIIGITLGSATKYWSHIALREKEKELLWRGNQYRNAIESYYRSNRPGRQPMYPPRIDALLKDSRWVNRRHLRKKYVDPMTGEDFEVVRDRARRIIGSPPPASPPPRGLGAQRRIRIQTLARVGSSRIIGRLAPSFLERYDL